jgi:hypothetical protein
MGNVRLVVVMVVRMKMILNHSDHEDHCTNRRQEIEQSKRGKHVDLLPSGPEYDLEIHLKRWSTKPLGAILFRAGFDKPLLSERLLTRGKAGKR